MTEDSHSSSVDFRAPRSGSALQELRSSKDVLTPGFQTCGSRSFARGEESQHSDDTLSGPRVHIMINQQAIQQAIQDKGAA